MAAYYVLRGSLVQSKRPWRLSVAIYCVLQSKHTWRLLVVVYCVL